MTNTIFKAAAAAALLVPALAFGEVAVVNGEAGLIFKDAQSTITRDQIRSELKAGVPSGDSHFNYVGGEAGWAHEEHRLVMQTGNLVHASDCPVMASLSAPTVPAGPGNFGYTGA
jgi:hypothetical protein